MNDLRWTDLGDGLCVRQSAAFQMNSTLLLDPEHSILVDPGVLPSEIDELAALAAEAGAQATTLLFTHAHWDHVLARPWWPSARTLAHDLFFAQVRRDAARIASEADRLCVSHGESWTGGFAPFAPDDAVSGLHFMPLGRWRIVIRDAPGHCASQITVHLPDHGVLIAADMLSDVEIPLLEGACAPYLETLSALVPLARGGAIETLIPGHGAIARGVDAVIERVLRDQDYLERLEREVGAARQAGWSRDATCERLANLEYGGAALSGSNRESHLENVGLAFDAGPAPAGGKRGSKNAPGPR